MSNSAPISDQAQLRRNSPYRNVRNMVNALRTLVSRGVRRNPNFIRVSGIAARAEVLRWRVRLLDIMLTLSEEDRATYEPYRRRILQTLLAIERMLVAPPPPV